MLTRTIFGSDARFCCEACADGFKCDREHSLIYPSYRVELDDGTWKVMGAEEASIEAEFCAYCDAEE